jgi:hypothetical protein
MGGGGDRLRRSPATDDRPTGAGGDARQAVNPSPVTPQGAPTDASMVGVGLDAVSSFDIGHLLRSLDAVGHHR